ncbi:MAG: DNA-directed polymerase [Pedosphaera sp.]|nr:DNA-directed polymerase [Pedosphaera sp.]
MNQDFVIFDLETTGLSPAQHDIIQIAGVRVVAGKIRESDLFFSYVNPGGPIPAFISSYTGITNADVRGAPGLGQVLQDFSRYVGAATLIAHNGHRFDMKFLKESCARHGLPTRKINYQDSIYLSRLVWGKCFGGHGLDAVLARLKISAVGSQRHDARGDVDLLARAVEKMWGMLPGPSAHAALTVYEGVLPALLPA